MSELFQFIGLIVAITSLCVNLVQKRNIRIRTLKLQMVKVGAVLLAVIGGGSWLGHILGAEILYKWTAGDVGMAVNTSVGFVVAGLTAYGVVDVIDRNGQYHVKKECVEKDGGGD